MSHVIFGRNNLEGILSFPDRSYSKGVLLLHPHPRYGGDMHNQVIGEIDRVIRSEGIATFRFNFKGVSSSNEEFEGPMESLSDAVDALEYLHSMNMNLHLGVVGYSYGASVALALAATRNVSFLVTLSASLQIFKETKVPINNLMQITCPCLMFHGTNDRVVPISDLSSLTNAIGHQVRSIRLKDEGHFYTSQLDMVVHELRELIRSV